MKFRDAKRDERERELDRYTDRNGGGGGGGGGRADWENNPLPYRAIKPSPKLDLPPELSHTFVKLWNECCSLFKLQSNADNHSNCIQSSCFTRDCLTTHVTADTAVPFHEFCDKKYNRYFETNVKIHKRFKTKCLKKEGLSQKLVRFLFSFFLFLLCPIKYSLLFHLQCVLIFLFFFFSTMLAANSFLSLFFFFQNKQESSKRLIVFFV